MAQESNRPSGHLKQTPLSDYFTDILRRGYREGRLPVYTQESKNWYRDQAKTVSGSLDPDKLIKNSRDRYRGWPVPGRLYLFKYDPKTKDKLPYYDTLPLVFPIDVRSDHMLGLNMHYLPHELRAKLMDALYAYMNNEQLDHTTRLQISYRILKSVSRLAPYKPCIKKYLRAHVRSRFVLIDVKEWDIALFMPLERFEGASNGYVWERSKSSINTLRIPKARGIRRAR